MTTCSLPFMKSGKYIVLLWLAGTGLFTCREGNAEYKYYTDLKNYLLQRFNLNLSEYTGKLLIIPVGGCAPCVKESLQVANQFSERADLSIVLMANRKKDYLPYKDLIAQINKQRLFVETEGADNDYRIGIYTPVFLLIESGEVVGYYELNTDNIQRIAELIFN